MDPIYKIDVTGNGAVMFYDYGESHTLKVEEWKVVGHIFGHDITRRVVYKAQTFVNRYKADCEQPYAHGVE